MQSRNHLSGLALIALGVVFGDIGTSPLYALRECFHGEYGIVVSRVNILGVLSLMFWTLIVIVSLKYLVFILRADNNGEGGIIALTSLIRPFSRKAKRTRWILVAAGLFGASLLYGDGMITPSISVLSAVEGLRIITPEFESYILPVTAAILVGLFVLQHRGTAKVGILFGPIILIWFCVLALLGFLQIINNPQVFAALLPWYGIDFLLHNHMHGFMVLGAVFLVATGAEALYADMGHFGKYPIRLCWFGLVLPAILLNYFGQGALLLLHPEKIHHPFYALVPSWAVIPMLILATTATIIASQAVITGAFSLTRQAVQIGYLPRLKIIHTSSKHIGQIYVPIVNWVLMLAAVGLVLGLQTSSKLAAAYGVAVTSTMLIATILFYVVASEKWHWSRLAAGLPAGLFLTIDICFFSANVGKIAHGAWFPLVIGMAVFIIMKTWKQGREILSVRFRTLTVNFDEFQRSLGTNKPIKIKGQAIFLTGNPDVVPATLVHNLAHNKMLHSEIAFLHFRTEEIPRVPNREKVEIFKLGNGFFKIIAHYGFMESPSVRNILSLAREQGVDFNIDTASIFLGREKLVISKKPEMGLWRTKLFMFLSRNALEPVAFYDIPADQVIEVGMRLEL